MLEYNYICPKCGNNFSIDKDIDEYNPHERCPSCGSEANRDMSKNYCNGNYIVNMSGFYGKTST
jgi:putative FmdB family regulatory protein